jgi:hypothetical protein
VIDHVALLVSSTVVDLVVLSITIYRAIAVSFSIHLYYLTKLLRIIMAITIQIEAKMSQSRVSLTRLPHSPGFTGLSY